MARNPFGAVLASLVSGLLLVACDGPADSGGGAASTAATPCTCGALTAIDGQAATVYRPSGCTVPVTAAGTPATVPWCYIPSLPQPPNRP